MPVSQRKGQTGGRTDLVNVRPGPSDLIDVC